MARALFKAQLRLFPAAARLIAGFTTVVATVATIDHAWYSAGLVLVGAVSVIRLPQRRRVLECGAALALLAGLVPALFWPAIGGLIASLLLLFISPEQRTEPMSGLDRLFISVDYAGFMDVHLWFDPDEPIDVLAVRSAVNDLLNDVPLARSFVRQSFWSAERFSPRVGAFDDTDVVTEHTGPTKEACEAIFNSAMAIDRRPPFAFDIFSAQDNHRLMLTVHHSFVDGVGALYLLDLFAQRYDLARGIAPSTPLALPPRARRLREFFADRPISWKVALVKKALGNRLAPDTRYAAIHDHKGADMGTAKLIHVNIDEERYALYQTRARKYACSTNTFIIACALVAGTRWRRENKLANEPTRTLVAADIRTQLGLGRSLQNWVSQIPVAIPESAIEVPDMISVINGGLAAAKDGEAMDHSLRLAVNAAVLPTGMARGIFAKREMDEQTHNLTLAATTIRWDPSGPLGTSSFGIDQLDAIGPVSRIPGVVLFSSGTRKSLSLHVGYRDGVLSDHGATRFTELFEAQLALECTPGEESEEQL